MTSDRRGVVRWVAVALGVYAAAAIAVLLLPVGYSQLVHAIADSIRAVVARPAFGDGWVEFGANILLFVPVGGLLTLLLRRPWHGVVLALAVSAAVEIAQVVIPSRQPSLRDIVANLLGALLGAGLTWCFVVRRERAAATASSLPSALDGADQPVPRATESRAPKHDAPN